MAETHHQTYHRVIAACLAYPDSPSTSLIDLVTTVMTAGEAASRADLQRLNELIGQHPRRIALVYGGATKIKGYVFEAPRLPEIRGASALLDWIGEQAIHRIWHTHLPINGIHDTEPHPYIIYASGGSFLAFAPCQLAQPLATAVERAYLEHTLTANSVAVTACFDLLELRYGRLFHPDRPGYICWIEEFLAACQNPSLWDELETYYYAPDGVAAATTDETALRRRFFNRKTFGELVTVLATMFHRRRDERASHGEPRYLPHYELMPWDEKCQSSDVRPAVIKAPIGADDRELSEASARKLAVGRLVKGMDAGLLPAKLKPWTVPDDLQEQSWEKRWDQFLAQHPQSPYAQSKGTSAGHPASDLSEIGSASDPKRYIGVIYADGNNIGRLMATLATPDIYHQVSRALSDVAQQAVFEALADHLRPITIDGRLVHPFEILAIGGDDLLIVVPGHKALDIAIAIARFFEHELTHRLQTIQGLVVPVSNSIPHRYNGNDAVAQ